MSLAAYSNHSVRYNNRDNMKSYQAHPEVNRACVCRWPLLIATTILFLMFLTFVITFIIFPIIFKCSPKLQRDFIFPIGKNYVEDFYEYRNFGKHGIYGVRNMYVSLQNKERITLGIWHVLPEDMVTNCSLPSFDYDNALMESNYPVLLYFHGGIGNRITYINSYKVLRKFFHVIAFDYRCYGDSSRGELSEKDIVEDSIAMYKWLRWQTKSEIYFWGYSLGCVLATHTVSKLKKEKITPMGLFLEASFPTIVEKVQHQMSMSWLTRLMTFMPWYESTMLKPFNDHGFNYNTTQYVSQVDCPIAIVSAQDDNNVPFILGFKLFDKLQYSRNDKQGNVTFYALSNYNNQNDHNSAMKLTQVIRQHIQACREYKNLAWQ